MEDILDYDENEMPSWFTEVSDENGATWAMRKLLAASKKIEEHQALADAERHRIDSWLERVNKKYNNDVEHFTRLLINYARKKRQADGVKTIKTPHGTVKSRLYPSRCVLDDEEQFLKWAKDNAPYCIKVSEKPVISNLEITIEPTETLGFVAMTEHGEIVPGIKIVDEEIKYTVEVDK